MDQSPSQAASLRNTPFPHFVSAQTADFFAYNMLTVAVGWQVYDLTRSALSLGLVGLAQFLPQFLLTLVVGHVADRYERRRVVMLSQGVLLCVCVVLALGSLTHSLTETAMLVCAAAMGGARAFVHPTMSAYLPTLVETRLLPRALALSASARQTGIIIGPALGGALYAAGAATVYITSATAFLLSIVTLSRIRASCPVGRREPLTLGYILGGIAYIRSKSEVLGAISLDLFSVLLGGATALLPLFARDILNVGPLGLGLLRAAPAVGALSMSLYLARVPMTRAAGLKMFAAVAIFGLSTIVFGLSHSFALSLAALIVLGASDMISVVVRSSLVQLETPDTMRGRVSAVNSVFIGTSNQLGEFESGVTAAWFGAAPAVVLGGVCTLLVVVVWMRLFPALRDRQSLCHGG
ncbi:MAG: MFS transporter [Humidesulfovibrio sp.]|nr:MFS transporter [Humidesulfovibrio sp.]